MIPQGQEFFPEVLIFGTSEAVHGFGCRIFAQGGLRQVEQKAYIDGVVGEMTDELEKSGVTAAEALLQCGNKLFEIGELAEALALYNRVISRFDKASEPALRERVATALVNKGIVLGQRGDSEQEIDVYDEVVARFGAPSEPALRELVATALFNKGIVLGERGDSEQEIGVYDDVVARFGATSEPALRELVATALVSKGVVLGQRGDHKQAIGVCDEVVACFGAPSEPALREQVARALVNKGVVLGQRGDSEQEIGVYDDVVARFGAASEPALREQVATALFNKGFVLGQRGDHKQAIGVYDDVVARFGAASEPALREQVAKALVNKGVVLGQRDDSEQEIGVYDDVVARFGKASEPALRERVATALVNKGVVLGERGDSEQAIGVYDDVVARFGAASEPALRELVATALLNKGVVLGERGDHKQAIGVCDAVVVRFGKASEPALRELVAMALFNKGIGLDRLGRKKEATAARRSAKRIEVSATKPAKGHAHPKDMEDLEKPGEGAAPSNIEQLDVARRKLASKERTTIPGNQEYFTSRRHVISLRTLRQERISEPSISIYDYPIQVNAATAFRLAVEILSKVDRSEADVAEAIEYLTAKAKAARETTGRATAAPRPKLTPEQVRETKARARLDGLQLRYEERLEAIELPSGGFTTKAQVKAADQLAGTYRALAEVQAVLNLPVTEKPERVATAEAMASAYRRSHDETGEVIPVRPRGRPRRAPEQVKASTPT